MPTTHRMRLLNVGAVLTAVLSLGAITGIAACEPAPPPPAQLPGNPHFDGAQKLSVAIMLNGGTVVVCDMTLTTAMDLSYRGVRIISKATATAGPCLSTDWINRSALGSCSQGSNLYSCGAGWALNTGGLNEERQFWFDPNLPTLGIIKVNFQAVLRFPSGLTFPVSVSGDTPMIRCSLELIQCKFQV
jgi:hypothetical protein